MPLSARCRRVVPALVLAMAVVAAAPALGSPAPDSDTAVPPAAVARQVTMRPAPEPPPVAATASGNVFVGRPWGVYTGPIEQAWAPYASASGAVRAQLGKIALTPKTKWFGAWIPTREIGAKVREYVAGSQHGNPDALVQATVFRMVPWEHEACRRLPTAREQADYRAWVDAFAAALGDAPTAIVLQPDGPFALCAPGGSTLPSQLVAYAAQRLSAQPRTSVYLEAGAYDWPNEGSQGGAQAALRILLQGGIQYARGIALNGTHYSDPVLEVRRGVELVRLLEQRGITGKTVIVNTATSGNPFEFGRYTGADPDNAFVCRDRNDHRTCVTLGIPPTPDVADPAWGLPAETRALAEQYVDAFVWFGRPWLDRQADPFVRQRALDLVASSPFAGFLPHVPDGSRRR